MKRFLLKLLIAFSFCLPSFSQAPPIEWENYYTPGFLDSIFNGETAGKVIQTRDGGYLVATSFFDNSSFLGELVYPFHVEHAIIKLDPLGGLEWQRLLERRTNLPVRLTWNVEDYARMEVEQTMDDGYLVWYLLKDTAGSCPLPCQGQATTGPHMDSMRILKLDNAGNAEWDIRMPSIQGYPFSMDTIANRDTINTNLYHRQLPDSTVLLLNTSVIITNDSIYPPLGFDSVILQKYDLNKNLVWEKTLADSLPKHIYNYASTRGTIISPTSDGGYISAVSTSVDDTLFYVHLTRLDTDFNIMWIREIDISLITGEFDLYNKSLKFVEQTADGYVIAGDTWYNGSWIIRLDTGCNIVWQKLLNGDGQTDRAKAYTFEQSSDGGYIIGGQIAADLYQDDYWAVKLDSSGVILWETHFGNEWNEIKNTSIVQTADEGYITCASSQDSSKQIWVAKYAPDFQNYLYVQAFADSNSNGIKDAGEPNFPRYFIQTSHESDTFKYAPLTDEWMKYNVYDTGVYITSIVDFPYYQSTPAQQVSVFPNFYESDSFSFAITPTSNVTDLRLSLCGASFAREGQPLKYWLIARNIGTQAADGTLRLVKDARVSYTSSVPVEQNVSGDTITWNFADFAPFEIRTWQINFLVGTPPTVTLNDTLFTSAVIEPTAVESTPSDNEVFIQQKIRTAIDPNDKEVNLKLVTPAQVDNGIYLDYIIRFQNTGNDTAFNVRIFDTLSNLLIHDSLDIVAFSHPAHLVIKDDSIMQWYFENIFLPDSNVNETASHGYVIYRIKARSGLADGTIIPNKAAIYFDYRDPVITNTTTTLVDNPTLSSVGVIRTLKGEMQIVPNPSNGQFQIELTDVPKGNYLLTMNDVKGGEVFRQNISIQDKKTVLHINVKSAEGIYLISLFNKEGILSRKVIMKK